MKWSVGFKIGTMNSVSLLVLIFVSLFSFYSTNHMLSALDWQQHTYKVLDQIEEVKQTSQLTHQNAEQLESTANSLKELCAKLEDLIDRYKI